MQLTSDTQDIEAHLLSRAAALHGKAPSLADSQLSHGDMSRRTCEVLAAQVPRVEAYSIDEMFLDLSGLPGNLATFCCDLRQAVRRTAKVPTCIGVGPTKTIAKLANGIAKDRPEFGGVYDLREPAGRARLHADTPAGEVWGIGGWAMAKLGALGVGTVGQLVTLDPRAVRNLLTVIGARV